MRSKLLFSFLCLSLLPGILTVFVLWVSHQVPHNLEHDARAMRDFANLWGAGRAVITGHMAVLFDRDAYAAWIRHLFGRNMPSQVWGYPPSDLLLAVSFAFLPLMTAFLLWTGGTAAGLWAAARVLGFSAATCTVLILSPAVVEDALSGQNGALTAALAIIGLGQIGRRPFIAGLCLGLLTLKPQLGLLIPCCLIASRDYRSIGWSCATAAVLVIGSLLAFGPDPWHYFFTSDRATMTAILTEPWTASAAQRNFVSPFIAARSLGATNGFAWACQGAVTLASLSLCWWLWRQPRSDRLMRLAATLPLTVLASAYAHDYDMTVTALTVIILASSLERDGHTPAERTWLALGWIWPGLVVLAMVNPRMPQIGALMSCIIMGGLVFYAVRRVVISSQDSRSVTILD